MNRPNPNPNDWGFEIDIVPISELDGSPLSN